MPLPTTPIAWFNNETSYGDIYGESTNWFDALTPTYDALQLSGTHEMENRIPNNQSLSVTERTGKASDRTLGSAEQSLKYPVLQPLVPYLTRLISPALACNLLESYASDVADGIPSPSSPLLLAHVFRKEALLSQHSPRRCTPALLASMLLVAAHTTESPFFGSSPSVRDKLLNGLLRLSLTLIGGMPKTRNRSISGRGQSLDGGTLHSKSSHDGQRPQDERPRAAYVDDIMTHMHIALVTMAAESKPPGIHWWHVAIQLAKEYHLNRDPNPPVQRAQLATYV